jgi:ribosomal protein L18
MPEYLVQTGLPNYPADLDDKNAALVTPLYRSLNTLAQNISTLTNNVQYSASERSNLQATTRMARQDYPRLFVQASVAINYGQLVNVYDSGGVLTCRLADRSLSRPAHGLMNLPNGAAVGAYTEIMWLNGFTLGVTGSVVGTQYWLSTGGLVTATKPTSGVIQPVGWGLGSRGFYLNIEAPR